MLPRVPPDHFGSAHLPAGQRQPGGCWTRSGATSTARAGKRCPSEPLTRGKAPPCPSPSPPPPNPFPRPASPFALVRKPADLFLSTRRSIGGHGLHPGQGSDLLRGGRASGRPPFISRWRGVGGACPVRGWSKQRAKSRGEPRASLSRWIGRRRHAQRPPSHRYLPGLRAWERVGMADSSA